MSTIVKQGVLHKDCGTLKGWKSRYCVLKAGQLLLHKAQNDTTPQATLELKDFESASSVDNKKRKFCLQLKGAKKSEQFCAPDEKEEKLWVKALQEEIDAVKTGRKSTASSAAAAAASPGGAAASPAKKMTQDDFEIQRLIGFGSFGKVYIVIHKADGKEYAMKVLNKRSIIDRQEVTNTRTERSILTKLRHPYLINLYYSFQSEDKLYFLMDYIQGGEMFYHLQKDKKFTEERVQFYGGEIALGIAYLHTHGIVYRDLKPENILIDLQGHICMIDFGISKEGLKTPEDRTSSFRGTPEYLAPEVLEGKLYGKNVDWWSFGTLICEMLTGLPPYYSTDVQTMFKKIMTAPLELSDTLSPAATDLITQFLRRDPEARLSDLANIRAHPFFASLDFAKLERKELTPPWVPPPGYVDSEIEPPEEGDEPEDDGPQDLTESMQQNFHGFTFVQPSGLDGISGL